MADLHTCTQPQHQIAIGKGTESSPCKVGCLDHPDPRIVRIVHISDTHLRHDEFLARIPHGDILVHSGDFTDYCFRKRWDWIREFHKDIAELNHFLEHLPHKHKIFVAGNHDIAFSYQTPEKIQSLLTNVVYLQDSSVIIEGIKFYGAPWMLHRRWAFANGFALKEQEYRKKWEVIPDDTDVLVTHVPPGRDIKSDR